MIKKEFELFEKNLTDAGYKRLICSLDHSDYHLYKAFHRDNKFEESRPGYQLFFKIYDYTLKDWPNLPKDMKDHVGIEVGIMASRTTNERIDLIVSFRDNDTKESIEELAESFYKWVETIYPKPREV